MNRPRPIPVSLFFFDDLFEDERKHKFHLIGSYDALRARSFRIASCRSMSAPCFTVATATIRSRCDVGVHKERLRSRVMRRWCISPTREGLSGRHFAFGGRYSPSRAFTAFKSSATMNPSASGHASF